MRFESARGTQVFFPLSARRVWLDPDAASAAVCKMPKTGERLRAVVLLSRPPLLTGGFHQSLGAASVASGVCGLPCSGSPALEDPGSIPGGRPRLPGTNYDTRMSENAGQPPHPTTKTID